MILRNTPGLLEILIKYGTPLLQIPLNLFFSPFIEIYPINLLEKRFSSEYSKFFLETFSKLGEIIEI
jgi:hypothetical protein